MRRVTSRFPICDTVKIHLSVATRNRCYSHVFRSDSMDFHRARSISLQRLSNNGDPNTDHNPVNPSTKYTPPLIPPILRRPRPLETASLVKCLHCSRQRSCSLPGLNIPSSIPPCRFPYRQIEKKTCVSSGRIYQRISAFANDLLLWRTRTPHTHDCCLPYPS